MGIFQSIDALLNDNVRGIGRSYGSGEDDAPGSNGEDDAPGSSGGDDARHRMVRGRRLVRNLSQNIFRGRLIEHFSLGKGLF